MKPLVIACILSCLSAVALSHEGAEGVVKERMDRFKESKESMKAIKRNLGDDASVIAEKASAIKRWANQMTDFFPEGSNQPPSEALPAIWANFEDFKTRAVANANAANDLENLARTGADVSALTNGFKALAKTCKNCHNEYRE